MKGYKDNGKVIEGLKQIQYLFQTDNCDCRGIMNQRQKVLEAGRQREDYCSGSGNGWQDLEWLEKEGTGEFARSFHGLGQDEASPP